MRAGRAGDWITIGIFLFLFGYIVLHNSLSSFVHCFTAAGRNAQPRRVGLILAEDQ
jgi:hypothetical protein